MKITKYPQSCFLLETNDKNILVDPGSIGFEESFLEKWKKADCVLITHKHGDHCHAEVLKDFDCPIYATQETQDSYPDLNINLVKEGDVLDLDFAKVEVVKAVHGYIPYLRGEKEIHEGVGYIIESEDKRIYFTSDTICFKNDYKCNVLCAPVSAHGLVMSPFEVALFSKELEATLVIPCHMDNPNFPVDVETMKDIFNKQETNYKLLKSEEIIELN